MSQALNSVAGRLSNRGTATFSGIRANIMLGGPDAPMTAIRMRVAENCGAPTHVSAKEDKFFAVTGGRVVFLIGEELIDAIPGDYLFVPKGVPHSFRADGGTAFVTLVASPAGHDQFFEAMGALPEPHEPTDVAAICARFGQQITGPVVR